MKRSIVPVALFFTLVVSVIVSLPLQGSVVALSVVGFMGSLAGLAWWVLWADRRPLPRETVEAMEGIDTDEPMSDDWMSFEEDFWAHVAEHEATSDLD
jgi:hypothetical protein